MAVFFLLIQYPPVKEPSNMADWQGRVSLHLFPKNGSLYLISVTSPL